MARKAKKRVHPMPKLGWKDLCLYWFLFILCFGGALVSAFFPGYYRSKLAEANANAIACSSGEGLLHFLWLTILLFIISIIICAGPYQQRYPVFGRADVRYGPPAYPRIYPLLMKNKPKQWKGKKEAARKKKAIIIGTVILSAVFVFSIAIYPRSLYGRYELLQDGTVIVFDSHNRQTEQYSIDEITSVCLDTQRTGVKGGGSWYAFLEFTFNDGDSCIFSIEEFGDDWTQAIQKAQQLKAYYGLLVSIEGKENLWKVVLYEDMTDEEQQLLFDLYESIK